MKQATLKLCYTSPSFLTEVKYVNIMLGHLRRTRAIKKRYKIQIVLILFDVKILKTYYRKGRRYNIFVQACLSICMIILCKHCDCTSGMKIDDIFICMLVQVTLVQANLNVCTLVVQPTHNQ